MRARAALAGKVYAVAVKDPILWPAFERYLEIISEASRKIPDEWKTALGPAIEWRRIADLGNHLRHVYDRVQARILWSIYEDDLDPLEMAIDAVIAAHKDDDSRS